MAENYSGAIGGDINLGHVLGDDFSASIEKFKINTIEKAEQIVKKAIFDMYGEIVLTSPEDTALFKANHQVGLDQIPSGTLLADTPVKGTKYNYASENEQQKAKLDGYKLKTITYICNNLRYAQVLEFGHSTQAPLGVYRKAALKFSQFIENTTSGM
jgi:hypothetical protein